MSSTAYLAIAAATSFALALLGFIVTLRPLGRRWLQSGALAVFVAAGLLGVVCVWQAGESADREQRRLRQEQRAQQVKAREEQRSLQAKIDSLVKAQTASAKDIAAVKKRTAPLERGPLQVEISNPQAVARQLQEPRWRQNGPLRWLPREAHPSRIDAQSAVELTIQADRELPSATIEVVCDAPILGIPEIEPAAFPSSQVNNILVIRDRTLRFTVVTPTLSEGQVLVGVQ